MAVDVIRTIASVGSWIFGSGTVSTDTLPAPCQVGARMADCAPSRFAVNHPFRGHLTTMTNPFGVVTGASSGVGFELARKLAERGYDLLIIAEDQGVEQAARSLRRDGQNQISAVRADLADYDGVERAWSAIAATGRDIDALALNAGRGIGGTFVGGAHLDDELNVIDVTIVSTVHLAKRVLPQMVERGSGRVLITASPGGRQVVDTAAKSFTKSFAEALREELEDTGVSVTALVPGPGLFQRADQGDAPEQVAEQGVRALLDDQDKPAAARTKMQGMASGIMPDRARAGLNRRTAEPGPGR